jgi:phosphatidylserine/phosphatidylglycerophosphate/cardiolipin synthase-like enzyme
MHPLISFVFACVITTHSLYAHSEVLFSPDDHPTTRLTQLLDRAKNRIHAAIYMITDKNISGALINAKRRGVDVQLIIDPINMEGSYGKGIELKKNNIDLYVFAPSKKNHKKKMFHGPIMHNKFALIDNQLWTGSFNWTKSANKQNQENVIITDDAGVCQKFEDHFQRIKGRCKHYGTTKSEPIPWWQELWESIKNAFYAVLELGV